MSRIRRVVWTEGALLGQQHFQLWDNYYDHQQQLNTQSAQSFQWGVATIDYDDALLPQGVFALKSCQALFPNGRWADYHDKYDEALTLNLVQETVKELNVYLALPFKQTVSGINGYSESDHGSGAWQGFYETVGDQYDPNREREVLLARSNLSLEISPDQLNGKTFIQIARLIYEPARKSYKVCQHFFMPCLKLSACQNHLNWFSTFVNQIERDCQMLHSKKIKHHCMNSQYHFKDFFYLNLYQSCLSNLHYFFALNKTAVIHPFVVYSACTRLIGELAAYVENYDVSFPAYKHDKLNEMFSEIHKNYIDLMGQLMPSDSIDISLSEVNTSEYHSNPINPTDLQHKQFCLAFYHDDMNETLVHKIKSQIKIAAPSKLAMITQSFILGIPIEQMHSPENNLSVKPHHCYFKLDKSSSGWNDIQKEGKIALFLGREIASCSFQLITY